ncbi:hypothetical protein [Streptomyces sp. NRRL B-24484]|uniref:hypothetical protein n=1 Tax=Streptomyces sp. NRRL B-24484 TaxID=1463833 RepID=UPI0004BF75D9|nr:hypothetical protein [Streptomyces sp. NRRL B-24484]
MNIAVVDPDALRTETAWRGLTLRTALLRALRPATGVVIAADPEQEADHRALREQLKGKGALVLTEELMAESLALLLAVGSGLNEEGRTFAERQAAQHALALADQLADPMCPHVCLTVA